MLVYATSFAVIYSGYRNQCINKAQKAAQGEIFFPQNKLLDLLLFLFFFLILPWDSICFLLRNTYHLALIYCIFQKQTQVYAQVNQMNRDQEEGSEDVPDILHQMPLEQPEEKQTFDVWLQFWVHQIKAFQGLTMDNRSIGKLASVCNIHSARIKDINAHKIMPAHNTLSTQR